MDGTEMIARLVIQGRFPSLNDYVSAERASKKYAASMKRRETKRVSQAARALMRTARGELIRFENPVVVSFKWVEPNARRDIDNIAFAHKFILDGLVDAGVLEGDSRKHVVGLQDDFPQPDPDNPRVEVTIMEV